MSKLPVIGQIRTFADVQKALENIRSYFKAGGGGTGSEGTVTTIIRSGSADSTVILPYPSVLIGEDGDQGEDGWPIRGMQGEPSTVEGPRGFAIPGEQGDQGEEGWPIPGPPGPSAVVSVTATAPLHSTGGIAPNISISSGSITQSMLKTSAGAVSTTGSGNLVLPGGAYGFYPRFSYIENYPPSIISAMIYSAVAQGASVAVGTYVFLSTTDGTVYLEHTYVTSSGEVFWIFLLRDKTTKKILAAYAAPDHPCFGNGGKPLVISHPFGSYDPDIHEILVITPTEDQVAEMEALCITDDESVPDRSILQVFHEDYEIDENSDPVWPETAVTVGLAGKVTTGQENVKMKSLGQVEALTIAVQGEEAITVKKSIPKMEYFIHKDMIKKTTI